MVGRCGEGASGQKNQKFGYYETEWLVKLWADEEIQQPLSVMSRKKNIVRTLPQNLMTMVTSVQHRTAKHIMQMNISKIRHFNCGVRVKPLIGGGKPVFYEPKKRSTNLNIRFLQRKLCYRKNKVK